MNRSATRPSRSGFSLVELLVVIGIIGILALIAVPTAQRIRDRAKQSSCLNNLKQWCYALTSYLDEHRGLMPAYEPGASDGWFNVRKSNTEPIIRIYSEAPTMAEAEALAGEVIGLANKIIGS